LERENSASSETGVWMAVTSLTKQKVRLNMKLLGQFVGSPGTPSIKEDKPTYREHFVPPEMSMISYFLNKVKKTILIFLFIQGILVLLIIFFSKNVILSHVLLLKYKMLITIQLTVPFLTYLKMKTRTATFLITPKTTRAKLLKPRTLNILILTATRGW